MTLARSVRRALVLASIGACLAAATAGAFEPTTTVLTTDPGQHLTVTDIASRDGRVVVTADGSEGSARWASVFWSSDQGATWDATTAFGAAARESQGTICNGEAAYVVSRAAILPASSWQIVLETQSFDGASHGFLLLADSGVNRRPDVACIADAKVAVAWFRKGAGSAHTVRLVVRRAGGEDLSPQAFNLGPGSVSKGLAVAATGDRVYVAWFNGNALKLKRFKVGPAPARQVMALGTATILTHASARDPRLAAAGARVVLAYQHQADLRVRRSTDRGVRFSGAVTVRNEPYPSEVGASPTTLAIVGSRVALGAVEIGGVETLTGKGLGYLSTNGGASFSLQSTHPGGRTVAALVKVGASQRYAEAWDQSIAQPSPEHLFYRRR